MKFPYWRRIPDDTKALDLLGVPFLALHEEDARSAVCRIGFNKTSEAPDLVHVRLGQPRDVKRLKVQLYSQLGEMSRELGVSEVIAIPDWQARRPMPLRFTHWLVLAIIALAVAAVVFTIGGPLAGAAALPAGLAAAALAFPVVRPKGRFAIRTAGDLRLDEHNLAQYARARLEGERPEEWQVEDRRASILARVDEIRREYVTLQEDIVHRIDFPALFDDSVQATADFRAALVTFDDAEAHGTVEELEGRASEVEITYATARRHAETVGILHVPEDKRDDARRASKAARLAVGATTEGERVASLTQAKRILDSLALHYMPRLGETLAIKAEPSSR